LLRKLMHSTAFKPPVFCGWCPKILQSAQPTQGW
jgi:hypothetical protein